MSLDTSISLTTVNEVLSYMGTDYPERNALWVYYDGANSTATVEVQDSKIVLTDSGTTNIAFATYDTLTKVVDEINNTTDWYAGLIYIGTLDSDDLVITGSLNAKGSDNEQTLKIKDEHLIEQLINRASDFLNRYCHRTLKQTTYVHERYDGRGETKLFLKNYPITAVVSVSTDTLDVIKVKYTSSTAFNAYVEVDYDDEEIKLIHDGTTDGTIDLSSGNDDQLSEVVTAINAVSGWEAEILDTDYNSYPSNQLFTKYNRDALNEWAYLEFPDEPIDDYDVNYDAGIIYFVSGFNQGFQNIYVSYTAGYASGSIPDLLEQICIELVKYKYDKAQKSANVKSEKIGSVYSYTLADMKKALPEDLVEQVNLFRRRLV